MKPSEVLRRARARIEKPENWCQKYYAVNEQGMAVAPESKEACSWCSEGALLTIAGMSFNERRRTLLYLDAVTGLSTLGAGHFNDTHTHAEVLDLFDRAIALAESEGR